MKLSARRDCARSTSGSAESLRRVAMNHKPELQQLQFRNHDFKYQNMVDHLHDQADQLREIQFSMVHGETLAQSSQVSTLDFDLLRYACAHLVIGISEAAKQDCAELVVESLFDMTGKTAAKYWESWLTQAPCWPLLAKEKWSYVLSRASKLVGIRLEAAGIVLTEVAATAIDCAILRLRLEDLVPADVIVNAFPMESSEEAGDAE